MQNQELNNDVVFSAGLVLTPDELEIGKQDIELFKVYLEYKTKLRQDMLNDLDKERQKEIEVSKSQNERDVEISKSQNERDVEISKVQKEREVELATVQKEIDIETMKKDVELTKIQKEKDIETMKKEIQLAKIQKERDLEIVKTQADIYDKRRKDAWAIVFGLGAAAITTMCDRQVLAQEQLKQATVPSEDTESLDNSIEDSEMNS